MGTATILTSFAVLLAWIPLGVGSGLYLGAALGPGPRDGLMMGLHRLTGRPVAWLRAGIEMAALTIGFLLGGTVGIGTVAFALLVGPAVALMLRVLPAGGRRSRHRNALTSERVH